ncbi:hypothetical protein [Citrobacter cronae]|uniref:hypothetical protein n=1 Tax=Citrobacter cronae TaxID=1748967 RepID=UPI0021CF775F|nr:hypothetical protein [Citrobacter cronae]MCU6177105.1 hypothetical protein [Citrobacter cronae]
MSKHNIDYGEVTIYLMKSKRYKKLINSCDSIADLDLIMAHYKEFLNEFDNKISYPSGVIGVDNLRRDMSFTIILIETEKRYNLERESGEI